MARKTRIETPPNMLGILRFNVDTTKLRLHPKTVIGITLGVIILIVLLHIAVPLQ
ncbi:MAG TPA: preprotein translocase subunit Sec61beta [Euryarchaeota archaeon]|nr:preprotein translocase subunit Sec61beta [Euryarchaeota archaeon]